MDILGPKILDTADSAPVYLGQDGVRSKMVSPISDHTFSAVSTRVLVPISSSPSASQSSKSESSAAPLDTTAYTQDSEPVPFSSTPDLGSRESSSSPNTDYEYDSQVVVTPPEEKFIRTLDQKLRALINATDYLSSRGWSNAACDQDAKSQSTESSSPVQVKDHDTSSTSTRSVNSAVSLKRKSPEPGSDETPISAQTTADDSDVEYKDKRTHPTVPVSKKLKETSFHYAATKAASARRAQSLSACSTHSSLVPTECLSPSRPSTPVYKPPAVPIIAPPEFEAIPRPPLTLDDSAEARLKILLQRERTLRHREGFEKGINDIFDSSTTKEQVDELLGIDEEFRKEVTKWMLRITPSKKLGVTELRHQLRTCPETRFHAILLFTRYFMRVGDAMPVATEKETPLMKLGRKRIVWDVAMSCLALAVKFNRDFLGPLSPVYSREFLILAPHPMSHDDFEISQKDVLQALDYEIRDITPGPFLQELWSSLPSLRKLLSFGDGWEVTQVNAWAVLNTAASASEMLQFPISLLTACALIEGAVEALVEAYEQDAGGDERDVDEEEKATREEAEAMIEDVGADMRELMGIAWADMKRCRRWLQKIAMASSDS